MFMELLQLKEKTRKADPMLAADFAKKGSAMSSLANQARHRARPQAPKSQTALLSPARSPLFAAHAVRAQMFLV